MGLQPFAFLLFFALCMPFAADANAQTFDDVSEDNPYYEGIEYLYEQGVVNGEGDGLFHPEDPINRAAATKILAKMSMAYSYLEEGETCFDDVDTDAWYLRYVCVANRESWVRGKKGLNDIYYFEPNRGIKRNEAMKMTLLSQGVLDVSVQGTEDDFPVWHEPYLSKAAELGLDFNDVDLNHLSEEITRGEFAQMAYLADLWVYEHSSDVFLTMDPYFEENYELLTSYLSEDNVDLNFRTNYGSPDIDINFMCTQEAFDLLETIDESRYEQAVNAVESWHSWSAVDSPQERLFEWWANRNPLLASLFMFELDPLHVAVNSGCLDIVERYLNEGASIEGRLDYHDRTALHTAADNGDIEMLEMILGKGFDSNTLSGNPLGGIVWSEAPAPVHLLSGLFARNPLFYTVENNDLVTAEILLEAGASVYFFGDDLLQKASHLGFDDMADLLLSYQTEPRWMSYAYEDLRFIIGFDYREDWVYQEASDTESALRIVNVNSSSGVRYTEEDPFSEEDDISISIVSYEDDYFDVEPDASIEELIEQVYYPWPVQVNDLELLVTPSESHLDFIVHEERAEDHFFRTYFPQTEAEDGSRPMLTFRIDWEENADVELVERIIDSIYLE